MLRFSSWTPTSICSAVVMAAERSTQARPVCKAFESIRKHLPACLLACLLARAFACLRVCAPVCFWCQTIVWQEYSFGKTGSGQTQTRHPFHPSAGCIVVLRRFKTLPRSLNCATTGALFNADHLVHLQVVGRVVGIALLHGESTVSSHVLYRFKMMIGLPRRARDGNKKGSLTRSKRRWFRRGVYAPRAFLGAVAQPDSRAAGACGNITAVSAPFPSVYKSVDCEGRLQTRTTDNSTTRRRLFVRWPGSCLVLSFLASYRLCSCERRVWPRLIRCSTPTRSSRFSS